MGNTLLSNVFRTLRFRLALLILASLAPVAAYQSYRLVLDREARLDTARERAAEIARRGIERFGDAVRDAQTVLELVSRTAIVTDGAPEKCREFLRDIERTRPWINGISVVDPTGRIACTTIERALGMSVAARPWYRQAKETDGFVVTDFFIGAVRGQPASMAAYVSRSPLTGRMQTYAITLDLSWFGGMAETIGARNNAQVMLIDSKGVLLARYPANGTLIGKDFSAHPLIRSGLSGDSDFYEGEGLLGDNRIFNVTPLADTKTYLIVGLDRDAVLTAIDEATLQTAVVFAVVCALMSALVWLWGRRIFVAPLETIAGTLQATLDHMDQGLMMIDAAGRVQVCNRRARELLDLPAGLMRSRPTFAEVARKQIASGEFDGYGDPSMLWSPESGFDGTPRVYERVRPNGIVLEIMTVPLADGGAVRTYSDITIRREAEAALRESEERQRALIDALPQKIWTAANDGTATYQNRQMIAYHGAIGTRLEDRLATNHPDDHPHMQAVRARATAAGEPFEVEGRIRNAAGEYRWHRLSMAPLRRRGEIVEWVGTSLDIHAMKETEQELAEMSGRAEEARRHAEKASEAKTEFLASMSHEIRTPLNGVLGYTDMLLAETALSDEQRRAIEHIQSAGTALLTVVNDILDFSRIEAGQIELEPRAFKSRNLIEDCVSIVEGLASAKRLTLTVDVEPAVPATLVGDDNRLRQILLNFLNNAVKFTRHGGVTVTVRAVASTPSQARLRFTVSDTGIGIPRDKLSRLFQRFSQVDGSIQREFGGSGLGLAISKRLVELMGGTIGVESREFEGSTFWFEVGLGIGAAKDLKVARGSGSARPTGRPARILLAEDIKMNQDLVCALLRRAGHQVDVVADGSEAVMAVQDQVYDLILMDVQMPVMDGITATQRIRAIAGPQGQIPIVAMTANVLPAQVARFREAGMNDHVPKPFKREELLAAIDRWGGVKPAEAAEPALVSDHARFDQAVFDSLSDLVGQDVLSNWMSDLGSRIAPEVWADCREGNLAAFARAAHALVSVSGMMGFMRLAEAARNLEQACLVGADVALPLTELRAECAIAGERLASLSPMLQNPKLKAAT